METYPGILVSIEGPDQSGKSTQIGLLKEAIKKAGLDPLCIREPGGTLLGEEMRTLLLKSEKMAERAKWTEALMYLVSMAQSAHELARPALRKGRFVLYDRYIDSTLVYQGMARGLGVEKLYELNSVFTGGLMPDLTLVFNVDLGVSRERLALASEKEGKEADRLEREPDDFHAVVAEGYRKLQPIFPERIVEIDGSQSVVEVHKNVIAVCNERLGTKLQPVR